MQALKLCASQHTAKHNQTCIKRWIRNKKYWEAIGWTIFGVAIVFLGSLTPIRIRDIPFQKTSAGDVIRDPQLNQRFVNESISSVEASLICILAPLTLQICFALFVRKDRMDVHYTWCAYATAVGLTLCTVEVLKNHVGRLRPNTYDYCDFDDELLVCTSTEDEWRKSFPSGHSATAFVGSTLLVCYLSNAVELKYRATLAWRIWAVVSMAPLVVAFMVASSRLVDNYHFPADVVFGAVIGASYAVISTYIHFPSQLLRSVIPAYKDNVDPVFEDNNLVSMDNVEPVVLTLEESL